jgi:hypothetical protein
MRSWPCVEAWMFFLPVVGSALSLRGVGGPWTVVWQVGYGIQKATFIIREL